ncbi:MAG: hypothetical protein AAF747_12185 [Planctomycetota bacterium]
MSDHTPEPWEAIDHGPIFPVAVIRDADDTTVARLEYGEQRPCTRDRANANAHRIAECVNACDGIADPSVVSDLMTACEEAADFMDDASYSFEGCEHERIVELVDTLRAVISKARDDPAEPAGPERPA